MRSPLIFIGLVVLAVASVVRAQQPWGLPLAELEARATKDSLDPDALYRLALGYARKQRWDDEGRVLHAAITLNPRYTPAYLALSFEPFQRRPALEREVRKGKVPPPWRDSLVEAGRLLHKAFLIVGTASRSGVCPSTALVAPSPNLRSISRVMCIEQNFGPHMAQNFVEHVWRRATR